MKGHYTHLWSLLLLLLLLAVYAMLPGSNYPRELSVTSASGYSYKILELDARTTYALQPLSSGIFQSEAEHLLAWRSYASNQLQMGLPVDYWLAPVSVQQKLGLYNLKPAVILP